LTFGTVMSELYAHQLSTAIGSILIGFCIRLIIRIWPPSSRRHAVLIGFVWVVLTMAFELFMGLVLAHKSLAGVLYDYNIAAGRVWALFLVWLFFTPLLFYRYDKFGKRYAQVVVR